MLPLFNPFLGTPRPPSQQVPTSLHVNPCDVVPNPLHMGVINPQTSIPSVPNMPNQFNFMPLQNNPLGVFQLGPAQSHLGSFNPLNGLQSLGQGAYQGNPSQLPASLFGHNSANTPGNLPFSLPNMNQNFPMPMSNVNQVGPYSVPQSSHHMFQLAQALGPQNSAFPNQQFVPMCFNGVGKNVHQDNQKLAPPMMGSNALEQPPVATQNLQGNWPAMATSSVQSQQTWKNQQPSNFMKSQGDIARDVCLNNANPNFSYNKNNSSPNWKHARPRKNFMKNQKGKNSHWGSQKSHLHHMQNARGSIGTPNENRGKGNFRHPDSTCQDRVEKKRSLSLNYTTEEIKNWREDRKKNYPSKANLEKKVKRSTNTEGIEAEAKSRRQQLKEILAKQAELGVEVAEIPPQYLSDSEKQQVQGRGEDNNKMAFGKQGFQNRGNKRRRHDRKQWKRHDQEDRSSKKQNLESKDSGEIDASKQPPLNKRKQTLLEKLLSTDMKRDKRHLLQVFRFMTMNSFFNDWPEKPLKYPSVVIKDTACQGEVVNLKSSPIGEGVSQGSKKTTAEESSILGESKKTTAEESSILDESKKTTAKESSFVIEDGSDNVSDVQAKETAHFGEIGGSSDEIEKSEEEGEIID